MPKSPNMLYWFFRKKKKKRKEIWSNYDLFFYVGEKYVEIVAWGNLENRNCSLCVFGLSQDGFHANI